MWILSLTLKYSIQHREKPNRAWNPLFGRAYIRVPLSDVAVETWRVAGEVKHSKVDQARVLSPKRPCWPPARPRGEPSRVQRAQVLEDLPEGCRKFIRMGTDVLVEEKLKSSGNHLLAPHAREIIRAEDLALLTVEILGKHFRNIATRGAEHSLCEESLATNHPLVRSRGRTDAEGSEDAVERHWGRTQGVAMRRR